MFMLYRLLRQLQCFDFVTNKYVKFMDTICFGISNIVVEETFVLQDTNLAGAM